MVVETPDSVFVSDLEHSRDVKTIVSGLKAKGRKEFQQHRSLYYPWGVSKLLEQRENYTAAELRIYQLASLQLRGDTRATQHLLVLSGQAKVTAGSDKKSLNTGQSFTPSAKGRVNIENVGPGELCMMHVKIDQANIVI